MRNYDYWKERKKLNKNKIILILSGIFYRTFGGDSRFLSDKFGFKIKETGGYEVVGFPKNSLEKYLNELKQESCGYIVYEKGDNEKFNVENEYKGGNELKYNKNNLTYLEKKDNNNNNEELKQDFQSFLEDLEKLILKYK